MKQPKLQSTKNASLFVYNDEQRPIHQQHVNFLASSMSRHGFLPSKAIQCYRRKDGKLIVIDGHHRLEAAKTLGITFYYVVESATSQQAMPDVNRSRQWGIADFIRQYAMRGLPDYKRLSDYIASGLNPTAAASLLAGESAGSANQSGRIKAGTFKVKTTENADKILSLMRDNPSITTFKNTNFVKALSLCLWLTEFDFGTFKSRAELNYHMIPKCSNVKDFLTSIEEVYNFRSRDKVPVAHLAAKRSLERQSVSK